MEYMVLARRFRPQAFAEVVGQQHIAQALKNAIAADRVAHAYLFTGARGVGKTSTARILAKSLNCPQAVDGEPCNRCDVCEAIAAGSDVDVLEIDGASNRSIDDIRSLRANVNVRSMRCRYKIYIIDEVHMLTREAFNALLKTLEEPPATVKFVFCTTEPHKLPDTILSRCQRFDFGTIAAPAIGDRLREIAAAEGILVEHDAIELVARRAAGSMRDSQSLFDQLLAFGGQHITTADVHRLLGTAPDERLIDLVEAIVAGRPDGALRQVDAALEQGVQLGELTDQLLAYLRDLMVLAAGAGEIGLLSVSNPRQPVLADQARRWGMNSILAALQILAEAKGRLRGVTYGRPLVELAVVRMASLQDLEALSQVVQQLRAGKLPTVTVNAVSVSSAGVASPGAQSGSDPPTAAPSFTAPTTAAMSQLISKQTLASHDDAPAGTSASGTTVPVAPQPFETGREAEFWPEVLSRLPDMTRSYAKKARPAISGPNLLVLSFPKGYNGRELLERSGLDRVERALADVVGKPVRVTCQTEPDSDTTDVRPVEVASETSGRRVQVPTDPLVKSAIDLFNGKYVRTEIGGSAETVGEPPARE